MSTYRGKKLSESSVLSVMSSVFLNKNLSEYERLLIVELLYQEFTIKEK